MHQIYDMELKYLFFCLHNNAMMMKITYAHTKSLIIWFGSSSSGTSNDSVMLIPSCLSVSCVKCTYMCTIYICNSDNSTTQFLYFSERKNASLCRNIDYILFSLVLWTVFVLKWPENRLLHAFHFISIQVYTTH